MSFQFAQFIVPYLRPQDAAMASPNQVRCMHVGWDDLDK